MGRGYSGLGRLMVRRERVGVPWADLKRCNDVIGLTGLAVIAALSAVPWILHRTVFPPDRCSAVRVESEERSMFFAGANDKTVSV